MASMNKPPAKKSRGEAGVLNNILNAICDCLEDMMNTVQERFHNQTPLATAPEVKNCKNDKTLTIYNITTTTRGTSLCQDKTTL